MLVRSATLPVTGEPRRARAGALRGRPRGVPFPVAARERHPTGEGCGVDEHRIQRGVERRLLEGSTLRDHLDDYAMRAGRHLGTGTEVSISLRHAASDRLVATGSARAARCDEVEYATGSGPCIVAMDSMQVVLVPDIAADPRWPAWRDVALESGFRSSVGVPAHVADDVEVALNLYSEELDAWDTGQLLRADTYAQQVAVTVGLCLQVAHLTTAHADVDAVLRELQLVNALVVRAIAPDEPTAAEMLRRVREVASGDSADVDGDVRRIVADLRAPTSGADAPQLDRG